MDKLAGMIPVPVVGSIVGKLIGFAADEADKELRAVIKQFLVDAVKSCFGPVRARFRGREDIAAFLGGSRTAAGVER